MYGIVKALALHTNNLFLLLFKILFLKGFQKLPIVFLYLSGIFSGIRHYFSLPTGVFAKGYELICSGAALAATTAYLG